MTENVCFMDRVESILKEKRLTQKELAEDYQIGRKMELFRRLTSACA